MKNSFYILLPIVCFLSYSHIQCNYQMPSDREKDPSNWYFSNDGRDRYHGHSPDHPKRTIDELNSLKLEPGDTVFFRSGGMWRERIIPGGSGSPGSPIVFTSYGAGDKPIISRSVLANTGDWKSLGDNLWINDNPAFVADVGNLIFNDDSVGVKEKSLKNLDVQGDFWFSYTNNSLTVYSHGNPASVYGIIECAIGEPAIELSRAQDHLVIDGLNLKYVGRHGIVAHGDGVTNITVKNCDFKWIGGSENYEGSGMRLGNGVEFFGGWFSDILIEKCRFEHIYDAGVTPQFPGTGDSLVNFYVNGNIFIDIRYAFEFTWEQDGNSYARSVHFNNNTIYNKNAGFGTGQRWGIESICPIQIFNDPGSISADIQIKNNIVYQDSVAGATGRLIRYQFHPLPAYFDIDFNLYYSSQTFENNHIFAGESGVDHYSLSGWRIKTKLDANSLFGDPLFADPPRNLKVNSKSGAVGRGIAIPEYSSDHEGVRIVNPPNIGAYE